MKNRLQTLKVNSLKYKFKKNTKLKPFFSRVHISGECQNSNVFSRKKITFKGHRTKLLPKIYVTNYHQTFFLKFQSFPGWSINQGVNLQAKWQIFVPTHIKMGLSTIFSFTLNLSFNFDHCLFFDFHLIFL